ncbi:glycosyltransferase [Marinobacter algicola]|uniref:glycosyltransferase n=1 Tax=Marinobacter algicola TaxID=236100 RepID=UPI003BAC92A5
MSIEMNKINAWVTWERQQRNVSMARIFSADYYEFSKPNSSYISRIIVNTFLTLKVFLKKYQIIFVQNPSIVLVAVSVLINVFFRKKLVVDAHNAGVFPLEGKSKLLVAFNNFLLKRSDLVIVSNSSLSRKLSNLGVSSIAMPDPIPELEENVRTSFDISPVQVFIICSWSDDEPIELYFSLAKVFPNIEFGISGKMKERYNHLLSDVPENLNLMGFLPENEYFYYLANSEAIIDLTTRNDCLVCGAYEAISVGVPAILSDTTVNREVFKKGIVFSECNESALVEALDYLFRDHATFVYEVGLIKDEMVREEERNKVRVLECLTR